MSSLAATVPERARHCTGAPCPEAAMWQSWNGRHEIGTMLPDWPTALELARPGLRPQARVTRRTDSYAIQLAPVAGDGRNEGSESFGCHIAHQAVGIVAAAEAAQLHDKGAAFGTLVRRWLGVRIGSRRATSACWPRGRSGRRGEQLFGAAWGAMGLVAGAGAGSGAAASPGCARCGVAFMGAGNRRQRHAGVCPAERLSPARRDPGESRSMVYWRRPSLAAAFAGAWASRGPVSSSGTSSTNSATRMTAPVNRCLALRIHGANYSPRNSSAGPTVRKEPNTSTRSPGRAASRAARQASATSAACARSRTRSPASCAAICCVLHGARSSERHENPGVDLGATSACVMPRMSLSPRMPHTAMRAPARGKRRRLSRSVSAAGTLCATSRIHSTSPGTR